MWQSVDSGYSKVLHITKAGGFKKAVRFPLPLTVHRIIPEKHLLLIIAGN